MILLTKIPIKVQIKPWSLWHWLCAFYRAMLCPSGSLPFIFSVFLYYLLIHLANKICSVLLLSAVCRHPVSVCLSVRPSRSWVAPKWIKISSKFFIIIIIIHIITDLYSAFRSEDTEVPSGSQAILVFPCQTG